MKFRKQIFLFAFLALILLVSACQNNQRSSEMPSMSVMEHGKMPRNEISNVNAEFEKLCKDRTPDNWADMLPMKDGKFTSDKSCWGCMSDDGMTHFCDMEEYRKYLSKQ